MEAFVYSAAPVRVVFGGGTLARLPEEVAKLGARRTLVLATPAQAARAEAVRGMLGDRAAGAFAGAVMHTPVEVTERAVAEARRLRADCLVALGGGSTIGLAKAIALRTDLPQVAVPTTYAGSEMTPVLGQTTGGEKTTLRDERVRPEVVLYGVDLTLTLPPSLAAVSGLNALAHAVEALYAPDGNPVVALMAEEAIRALGRALPRVVAGPEDREARSDALYGAWLAACCLGAVAMGLHHKLCHALGGGFGLPHAETHAVVLPYAAAFNAPAAPAAMSRVARALGAEDAAAALWGLGRRLGAPPSLAALGLRGADLDRAVALATGAPYPNPRPITPEAVRRLLEDALAGRTPAAPSGT